MNDLGYKAAKLIEKYGHVKGYSGSKEAGFCAMGALCKVAGIHSTPLLLQNPELTAIRRKARWYLPPDTPIVVWNDIEARTPEEVMDFLIALDYLE